MTYSESWPETITHAEAMYEIGLHDTDTDADFYADCGYKEEYLSKDVLAWLGY